MLVLPLGDSTLYGPKNLKEFLAGAAGDGRLNVRLQFQVDEITFSETSLSAGLVYLSLHSLLGAEQMKSDQVMHSFPLFKD
jgi:hypothetical protein